MTFGKILKQLRESNNYSMDKLVELYNTRFNGKMNKSTLSRYENELQEPMYTVIVNLAQLFNVTVDYLSGVEDIRQDLTEEKQPDELDEYLQELRTRPEMKMLFNLTKNATKEDVEKAVKIIETMLGK